MYLALACCLLFIPIACACIALIAIIIALPATARQSPHQHICIKYKEAYQHLPQVNLPKQWPFSHCFFHFYSF